MFNCSIDACPSQGQDVDILTEKKKSHTSITCSKTTQKSCICKKFKVVMSSVYMKRRKEIMDPLSIRHAAPSAPRGAVKMQPSWQSL